MKRVMVFLLLTVFLLTGCNYGIIEGGQMLPENEPAAQQTQTGLSEAAKAGAEAAAELIARTREFAGYAEDTSLSTLSNGSRGDAVKALQSRMRVLGLTTSGADGVYGPKTSGAVMAAQSYLDMEGSGIAGHTTQRLIRDAKYTRAPGEITPESSQMEIERMQRRLAGLGYLSGSVDGVFGKGTAAAISECQKQNKLTQTGQADKDTLSLLFSEDVKAKPKPTYKYMIKVSVADQRTYVYAQDASGKYSKLVKSMISSTGLKSTPTPYGTFKAAGPVARWYYFPKFKVWAQYAFRISGPYLFHSVLYNKADTSTLIAGSKYKLGQRASHGCIRLLPEDAKWLYQNCKAGTTVVVY